jgi:ferredoxin
MSAAQTSTSVLHIDWTKCDGRGLCAELVPDLLGRDEWGYPIALKGPPSARSDIPLPSQRLDAAIDAVRLCPVMALTITGAA